MISRDKFSDAKSVAGNHLLGHEAVSCQVADEAGLGPDADPR